MKKLQSILLIAAIGATLSACNSGGIRRNPGKAYAMDMTYSRAYDAYSVNPVFADSMSSRLTVPGTIARDHALPVYLQEGDTNAYKAMTTSLRFNEEELQEGARLYNIYCGVCHGAKIDGNGPLYASGKFAAMPANLVQGANASMPVGQIYAAIKFGKGAMGSYASQLDEHQRWLVIAYIKQVQSKNGGAPFTMGTDAAAAMATPAPATDTAATAGAGTSNAPTAQ